MRGGHVDTGEVVDFEGVETVVGEGTGFEIVVEDGLSGASCDLGGGEEVGFGDVLEGVDFVGAHGLFFFLDVS